MTELQFCSVFNYTANSSDWGLHCLFTVLYATEIDVWKILQGLHESHLTLITSIRFWNCCRGKLLIRDVVVWALCWSLHTQPVTTTCPQVFDFFKATKRGITAALDPSITYIPANEAAAWQSAELGDECKLIISYSDWGPDPTHSSNEATLLMWADTCSRCRYITWLSQQGLSVASNVWGFYLTVRAKLDKVTGSLQ